MDYPIWELALGGGMLMAIVAIPHVIVAHFAVGGGLLIAVTETLAVKRNDPALRELARRSSLVLILVSTVFGAISGVGIWVVAGLISPGAISALIRSHLFSNGLLVSEIPAINENGVLARSGWAARGSDDPVAVGRRVFVTEALCWR